MPRNTVAPKNKSIGNVEEQARSLSARSNDDDDDEYHDAPRVRKAQTEENNITNYVINEHGVEEGEIYEYEIEQIAAKPQSLLKKTWEMPRWLLLLLANLFVILLIATFCVVFIFDQSKVGIGQACLTNKNCNSYVGLQCAVGKCACTAVEFWNGLRCTPQRTYNRSCTSQSQCNSLSQLLCMNATIGLYTDSLCLCSSYQYWTGDQCTDRKSFNTTCTSSSECDATTFLTCINGLCDCTSTQFWNYEYCENERTYGGQCFTDYWCDNATGGLACSTWSPTTGTCDCLSNQYWWSGNNTCLSQLPINATCLFSYQCLTNQSLYCSSYTTPASCQCSENYWYNTTKCTPRFLAGSSCTSSLQCDSTLLLSCNLTAQTCSCNESTSVWDGSECVVRRSIGGACSSNAQCLTSQNLTCATSGVWNGTCACPTNYYWNTSISLCVIKKLWNQTCSTSYECYDGGYLSCQPSAAVNATVCDCGNYTYYWTGFLNNTYSGYCTPKINYDVTTFSCVSSYQCRDYNYVTCIGNQCTCSLYQYWDGTLCEPRLNYSYPCNSTLMCRNWTPGPNLQCLTPPGGSIEQCLCTPTQYFDYCADYCYTAKSWQQPCNISSCYATSMCDQTRSLSCINNICNCSVTQWWNSTACLSKGTYLSSCTTGQNFQCQDYNLLSCVGSQCQCSSVAYWSNSSNYCLPKQSNGGACTSTSQCLTAAGVGLSCISNTCQCSSGYVWNSVAQQCDPTSG